MFLIICNFRKQRRVPLTGGGKPRTDEASNYLAKAYTVDGNQKISKWIVVFLFYTNKGNCC